MSFIVGFYPTFYKRSAFFLLLDIHFSMPLRTLLKEIQALLQAVISLTCLYLSIDNRLHDTTEYTPTVE